MKSCCFAGDNDEYVLSGSDDFNLYMWRIPKDNCEYYQKYNLILHGHNLVLHEHNLILLGPDLI